MKSTYFNDKLILNGSRNVGIGVEQGIQVPCMASEQFTREGGERGSVECVQLLEALNTVLCMSAVQHVNVCYHGNHNLITRASLMLPR